jgi:hypothetical protein
MPTCNRLDLGNTRDLNRLCPKIYSDMATVGQWYKAIAISLQTQTAKWAGQHIKQ